ncbi:MAG: threonine synthase [Lachnospiraceae bacterium]|nr:threonine synthase [Lachnospiraceae bacterium]
MRKFVSSKDRTRAVNAFTAITQGLSPDGGLYTPVNLKESTLSIKELEKLDYKQLATTIISTIFDDFTLEETKEIVEKAYGHTFMADDITPLEKVGKDAVLKLYYGPTGAFKDVALTILPHLLVASYKKLHLNQEICILTATSGDTGKAALEGFKDVEHTHILVFYPEIGVSKTQKRQMQTTTGSNTKVVAMQGDFDTCQSLVKAAYQDPAVKELCSDQVVLSSANSINIGRLVPQIVYYFKAYNDLLADGTITCGEQVHFSVPTGNFGDILAGYYAKCLGLPIGKLICASNSNHVLTDFIATGVYDRNRTFLPTTSPSMDILVSSNLERLLFEFSGYDSDLIKSYMQDLNTRGRYEVKDSIKKEIKHHFCGYYTKEEDVIKTIQSVYHDHHLVLDPHTAVAYHAKLQYQKEHPKDATVCVVLSTASPYKFSSTVMKSIAGKEFENDRDNMEALTGYCSETLPDYFSNLYDLPLLHTEVITKELGMKTIAAFLSEAKGEPV